MRIVSYNILDGGVGRADPLAEIIIAQHPDIVALVEADDCEIVDRIAKRLNMDSIIAMGQKHAAAVLSHWPIVQSINHAALRGGPQSLLEVLVQEPGGREWIIGTMHLHPYAFEADEAEREREIVNVLEIFEPHRRASRPHLLVGDFNSNSPIQQIDPDKVQPKTRQAWFENGNRIPRRAVQKILDAGYLDTLAVARPEIAAIDGSFTTQFPGQQVDYIFAFGLQPSQVKKAWIEHDRLAKYASDHFPIAAEIVC